MKKTIKILATVFLILTLFTLYTIFQTAYNYALIIDTSLKSKTDISNVNLTSYKEHFVVNFTMKITNPSQLEISIYMVSFSVYIYNKTSFQADPFEHILYATYYRFEKEEIKVLPNGYKDFNLSLEITEKYYVNKINWILETHKMQIIDINCFVHYKIMPFEYKRIMFSCYLLPHDGGRTGYGF